MRGRQPLARVQRKTRGYLGRHMQNLMSPSPERTAQIPQAPAFLSKDAMNKWRRLAPRLHKLDLMNHEDQATFAAYCEERSTFKAHDSR